jgi:hypothetical protein
MRRLFTHLLARVAMVALVGEPTPALAEAPGWVSERPAPPGYAVGIGGAQIDDDLLSAAHNRALTAALADIAAQLEVDVETSSSLQTQEGVDGLVRRFDSTAHTASTASLQGVDIVATWCGEDRCWVYARLDLGRREMARRQADDRRQQRLEELLARLSDPRSTAAAALAAGAEAVELTHGDADIVALWRRRIARIDLSAIDRDGLAVVEIIARDDGDPASLLPVRFAISAPQGKIEPLAWTDRDGRAGAAFEWLGGPTTVTACLDPCAGRSSNFTPSLAAPPRRCVIVRVERVRRRTHLTLSADPVIAPGLWVDITSLFAAHGLDVVAATDTASMSVDITLRVSPGGDTGGVCFAFVDVAVVVTDGGERIHATTASRIRGAGLTRGEAVRAALRTPGARLGEATIHGRRVRVRVAPRRRAPLEWRSS